MTDGRLKTYGGKMLRTSGKLATADACCCGGGIEYGDDCLSCFDADETPLYYTVTFDGLITTCIGAGTAAEDAIDCINAIGDVVLTQDGANPCLWEATVCVNGDDYVEVALGCSGGTWSLTARMSDYATIFRCADVTADGATLNANDQDDAGDCGDMFYNQIGYDGGVTVEAGDQT